jgi:site-specific DNA-methyltransferase (adenine-specific)/modification methylase
VTVPAPEKVVIGSAELWWGDCRDVLPLLGACDVTITAPPYGVGLGSTKGRAGAHGLQLQAYASYSDTYENYVQQVVPALTQAIQRTGRAAVFIGPHIHELPKFDALGGVYCSAATGRHQWGFKNLLPVLLYGTYPDLHKGAHCPTVLASNETAEKNGHPVPKPVGWMRWLVALTTRSGETVLDPFMGSGTTGVAALSMGRKFIGIERERSYFDIAVERIAQGQAQGTLLPPEEPRQLAQAALL